MNARSLLDKFAEGSDAQYLKELYKEHPELKGEKVSGVTVTEKGTKAPPADTGQFIANPPKMKLKAFVVPPVASPPVKPDKPVKTDANAADEPVKLDFKLPSSLTKSGGYYDNFKSGTSEVPTEVTRWTSKDPDSGEGRTFKKKDKIEKKAGEIVGAIGRMMLGGLGAGATKGAVEKSVEHGVKKLVSRPGFAKFIKRVGKLTRRSKGKIKGTTKTLRAGLPWMAARGGSSLTSSAIYAISNLAAMKSLGVLDGKKKKKK